MSGKASGCWLCAVTPGCWLGLQQAQVALAAPGDSTEPRGTPPEPLQRIQPLKVLLYPGLAENSSTVKLGVFLTQENVHPDFGLGVPVAVGLCVLSIPQNQ